MLFMLFFYHGEVLHHMVEVVSQVDDAFAVNHEVEYVVVGCGFHFVSIGDFEVGVGFEGYELSKEIGLVGGVDKDVEMLRYKAFNDFLLRDAPDIEVVFFSTDEGVRMGDDVV